MTTTPATLAVQARRLFGTLALSDRPQALRLIDRAYQRWTRRCDAVLKAEQTAARIAWIIDRATAYDTAALDGMPTADLMEAKAACKGSAQFAAAQHIGCELRRRETFARCMAMGPASAPKPRYIGQSGRVGHTAISTGRRAQ